VPDSGVVTIDEIPDQLRIWPLKATSAGRDWEGVHIDEFAEIYLEDFFAPPRDHANIAVCTGTSPLVITKRSGKTFASPSRIGEFSINPAGHESHWTGLAPAHVSMRPRPDKLEEMAGDLRRAGMARFQFVTVFRLRDPMLDHIARMFSLELNRAPHPVQDLLIDSLAVTLCAHLLRSYTNAVGIEERASSPPDLTSLARAIAYIEDHPDRSVSLAELAGAAGVSRYHFARLFKRKIGLSPVRYVERSRIERAKALIVQAELSLAAVAQAVGFADQSHFTRRFKFHEGRTPGQFAREQARGILPRA
jgi:AraC family transcriptional regulator